MANLQKASEPSVTFSEKSNWCGEVTQRQEGNIFIELLKKETSQSLPLLKEKKKNLETGC